MHYKNKIFPIQIYKFIRKKILDFERKSGFFYFLDLLNELTIKELKVRYKNTTLGFLWVIVYPVIQGTIIGFIFTTLYHMADHNYQYILFLNLLIWNFFSSSLEYGTYSILKNRSIIKKSKFPYIAIPLSIITSNNIHFIFSLIILVLILSVCSVFDTLHIFSLFVGYILLLFFTSGFVLISSSLHIRRRDVGFLIHAFLMVWFYATPIIYSMQNIPHSVRFLWNFNPLTSVVILFQNGLFNTPLFFEGIIYNILIILSVFLLGLFMFRKSEDSFDDYI